MSTKLYRKVVLLGDTGVGKTSIRRNYMGSTFDKDHLPTLGADFAVKKLDVYGDRMDIQIWDLGGQRGFEPLRARYFFGSHGALFVFDLTRPGSFTNLPRWFEEFRSHTDQNDHLPVIILGNKSDLDQSIEVEREQVLGLIVKMSKNQWTDNPYIHYFETSAKTGLNIVDAFDSIARDMYCSLLEEASL